MTSEHRLSAPYADQGLLIADLFHALHQPLTSLHCALELMIGNPSAGATSRDGLKQVLAQADQITEYAADLRELWLLGHSEDLSIISLDALLREIVEEERMNATAGQVAFVLSTEPCSVLDDRQRLRLALRRLIAYAADLPSNDQRLRIELRKASSHAQLTVRIPKQIRIARAYPLATDSRERQTSERRQNLRLAVVRHLFSARSNLLSIWATEHAVYLRASLPLA